MKQNTFYLGIGFDGAGRPILPIDVGTKRKSAVDFLTTEFGGVTIMDTVGSWRDGDTVVKEPGLAFVVVADIPEQDAQDAGEFLRKLFNQKSVVVTQQDVTVSFVTGPVRKVVELTEADVPARAAYSCACGVVD